MNELERLTELFMRFPGIGPRQARRFVLFLLRQDAGYRNTLVRSIQNVATDIQQCTMCLRFASLHKKVPLCDLCAQVNRSDEQLMIVEKDPDIEQMERSGAYNGRYIVLGGTLSLTGKKSSIREKELDSYLKKRKVLPSEIIIALSATPDGEYTANYLSEKFKKEPATSGLSITMLGRGLSTGSELEYADAVTLMQALKNRA